jgi:hypothetical protein
MRFDAVVLEDGFGGIDPRDFRRHRARPHRPGAAGPVRAKAGARQPAWHSRRRLPVREARSRPRVRRWR